MNNAMLSVEYQQYVQYMVGGQPATALYAESALPLQGLISFKNSLPMDKH